MGNVMKTWTAKPGEIDRKWYVVDADISRFLREGLNAR